MISARTIQGEVRSDSDSTAVVGATCRLMSGGQFIDGVITEGIVDISSEAAFNGIEGTEYPGYPYNIISKNAYMIHSKTDSYYEVDTQDFTIGANQFYRISVWVKTVGVSSTSGAYVYLINKSEDDEK